MRRNLKMPVFRKSTYLFFSAREWWVLLLKGVLCMMVLNFCFYRRMIAFLFLWIPALFFVMAERDRLAVKKREDVRQQFKEMLSLTAAGQRAGYAVENAFLSGYEDLVHLYGSQSSICRMLRRIKAGMENHIAIGPLWKNMGEDCDIVEIREFAQVFSIAKESGGNMVAILESTASLIADKSETKKEIALIMSAKQLERRIMNLMPLCLIGYMNLTSPGYFDSLYRTTGGMLIMTGCLIFYIAVYLWGERLGKIAI